MPADALTLDLPTSFCNDSEAKAYKAVLATFGRMFPVHRMLANVILPTGDVRGPKTSEYDLMFICSGGIFIFEVKGWRNGILKSAKDEEGQHVWFIERPNGSSEPISDPIAQGGFKVRYLLEELKGIHSTQYVLCTEDSLSVDLGCNAHAVHVNDLPYLARSSRATARKFYSQYEIDEATVNAVADTILQLASAHTPGEHIANVSRWIKAKGTA